MDFFQVLSRRRSIRKYKDTPVEDEKLSRILEAVRLAPSARNGQPWHFIVISDPALKQRLKEKGLYISNNSRGREWFFTAPVLVCVCGEPPDWTSKSGKPLLDIDVSIAFTHFILAATAEGLGTCWVAAFNAEVARKVLNIPQNIEPISWTTLGYPDETPPERGRKALSEIVHWDKW
jgi:nitroreductase